MSSPKCPKHMHCIKQQHYTDYYMDNAIDNTIL